MSDDRFRMPWAPLATTALGTLMATLDGSIANTALPTIARELQVDAGTSIWVVNAFQLAVTMTLLTFAFLGDARGATRIYRIGLALFTVASIGCALARTFDMLVTMRIAQGIGASAMMAIVPSINRSLFPAKFLGRGVAVVAVVVASGTAAGPTIGGLILAVAPWPVLFAINIPLGLVALYFSFRTLPRVPGNGAAIDAPSVALSAMGMGGIIYGLDGIARHAARAESVLLLAGGVGALAVFIARQRRIARPLLGVELFARPVFSLAIIASTFTYLAQGLAFVSLPFFFQSVMGRTPLESGLLLSSWPLATALIVPLTGRLADRYPASILSTIGISVMGVGLLGYALLPASPSLVFVIACGAISGAGFCFFQTPNNRALLLSAPAGSAGRAGGILAAARLSGQTLGAAIAAIVFTTLGAQAVTRPAGTAEHGVIAIALSLAAASCLGGAIASSFRLGQTAPVAAPST